PELQKLRVAQPVAGQQAIVGPSVIQQIDQKFQRAEQVHVASPPAASGRGRRPAPPRTGARTSKAQGPGGAAAPLRQLISLKTVYSVARSEERRVGKEA